MTAASMHHKSTLDGLPKQFVSAMRTLFDLMDDKRTGFVRLGDIQSRWDVDGGPSLPNGAIECLRKVTPANGLLSFERFCAGLRICLLRHDNSSRATTSSSPPPPPRLTHHKPHQRAPSSSSRPASVPIPEMNRMLNSNRKLAPPVVKIAPNSGSSDRAPSVPNVMSVSPPPPHPSSSRLSCYNNNNTAAVRPNNVRLSQQRATSMPHLQNNAMKPYNPTQRSGYTGGSGNEQKGVARRVPNHNHHQPRMSKAMVAVALEKWRMMKSYHPPEVHASPPARGDVQVPQPLKENQLLKRDAVSYPNLTSRTTELTTGMGLHIQERGPAAKKANRKREPRRHTVSNGIDYNMIKRLKLLEQEKECLLQGLDIVERARNWYVQQIAAVTEKLERVSKYDLPHSDYSMDAHRERLNFQMTRIAEVNQHLNALMDTSEKGFPIHMNLAVQQHNIYDRQRNITQSLQKLKEQNNVLKEEVSKKSGMITQLESEKSALIRELFLARSQQQKDSNDTTLW